MSTVEDTFREEAAELLVDLEAAMLELEETPDDNDCIDRAFRAMHTIKGSGAMFGFDKLAAFTHHLENAFDLVRNGELKITKDLISISLDSGDHIKTMLDDIETTPEQEEVSKELLVRLSSLVPIEGQDDSSGDGATQQSSASSSSETNNETFRIRIKPTEDALASGMDPLPILRELDALGDCHITTLLDDLPTLETLDAEVCYLAWDVVLTTDKGRSSLDDVFIFVQDDWAIDVGTVDGGSHWSDSPDEKQLGEILVERGDATSEQVANARSQQKPIGEILQTSEKVSAEKINTALEEQKVVKKVQKDRKAAVAGASIKVPADKLDFLMDLVGELVIAQGRLNQTASDLNNTSLVSVAEDMERLTTELRDTTLGMRMLPIGTTFARFRRLVRDLSNDLEKEIELITEGAETELDKTVIDKLGDPLVHLIRNSLDHGIEMPEVRVANGKPAKGTVKLSALHHESYVLIEIRDDGAGMDAEVIRAKAIERGLIAEGEEHTDKELFNMVFEAGFSTAKTISNISGRGVGMDVVKRSIEALNGKVWIDSEKGKGSVVTVELPLTLAIIEGLLVKVEDECYVLPLSMVEECIELSAEDNEQTNSNSLIEVRGELVPYMRLRNYFGQKGELPDIEQIVIARMGDDRFGFTVDEVIGQHQTVIKGLSKLYEDVSGLSGATILGDGAVALILDAPALVKLAKPDTVTLH